ncbi:MAG TPA: helix-turn-helix transcriptional regulator [Aquabacterium sp.]|nr:helix-turn-helix transcriptional regulator [Aquabacterium sp.]
MWQRLRAARHYADKTQADVAKVLGVSRAAIALHESRDPNIRTRPTAEQVMAISKLTGVPAEFLMSDLVNPDDVWKYADRATTGQHSPQVVQAVAPHTQQMILPSDTGPQDRLVKGFWAAVEFHVVSQNPSKASCFAQQIDAGGVDLRADYVSGKVVALFTAVPTSNLKAFITTTAGTILLIERAMHKPMHKHILLWSQAPVENVPAIAEAAQRAFGVQAHFVTSVEQAATLLTSLE